MYDMWVDWLSINDNIKMILVMACELISPDPQGELLLLNPPLSSVQ
jgi:hypothetical protein